MDITDSVFHFTAEAQVLRNSPRAGGRANLGITATLPINADHAWKTQAVLQSPGDMIEVELATGEIVNTSAITGIAISGAFTATLPPAGLSNGKQTYATDALWATTAGRTMARVRWISSQWQMDRYTAGVLTHRYVSSSAVATPDLASGWTQTVGPTTTGPTVTTSARTVSYLGGDGRDINGLTLETPSDITLLVLAASTGITAAHTALNPSGSSHQIWFDVGGINDITADTLTLTAKTANTTVALLAYGYL